MNGFKKLRESRLQKQETAVRHHTNKVTNRIMIAWRIVARSEASVKEKIADEFYAKVLLKHYYFDGIKMFKQSFQIELAKAGRFYRYNIKVKLFHAWRVYSRDEKRKSIQDELRAEEHDLMRIKVKYFKEWRQFPGEMRRLKARQKRLEELRNKVKEMVPDFEPPSTSASNS